MGFTLTELMLAFAIAGIITGGITMTIFSVVDGSARTSNHMTAVRQVQNAGYWVSHDTLMAQAAPIIVDNLLTPAHEFLTLTWTDWETKDKHQVVYTFASNTIQRKHYLNDATSPDATLTVSNISSASCSFTNGELVFTVTATVGEQTETRIYEVVPRPG
jgi:type II secretory pathway pseudopilin PulG